MTLRCHGPCRIAAAGSHIYGTNGGFVGRANLDGTGVNRRFIRTPGGACGVAVYQGHIYWTQGTGGRAHPSMTIGRANLDGSAVNNQFITGIHDCGGPESERAPAHQATRIDTERHEPA
jgi:hypothetical protein